MRTMCNDEEEAAPSAAAVLGAFEMGAAASGGSFAGANRVPEMHSGGRRDVRLVRVCVEVVAGAGAPPSTGLRKFDSSQSCPAVVSRGLCGGGGSFGGGSQSSGCCP